MDVDWELTSCWRETRAIRDLFWRRSFFFASDQCASGFVGLCLLVLTDEERVAMTYMKRVVWRSTQRNDNNAATCCACRNCAPLQGVALLF